MDCKFVIQKCNATYLDEAVVEDEADESGADAGVLVDELLHLVPHDGLHAGARLLVVAQLQAVARRRERQRARHR
ncbi:Os03g0368351, partial [Oryza sativa Japonica Group]